MKRAKGNRQETVSWGNKYPDITRLLPCDLLTIGKTQPETGKHGSLLRRSMQVSLPGLRSGWKGRRTGGTHEWQHNDLPTKTRSLPEFPPRGTYPHPFSQSNQKPNIFLTLPLSFLHIEAIIYLSRTSQNNIWPQLFHTYRCVSFITLITAVTLHAL